MARLTGVPRLVLPSPNGSMICAGLADADVAVVGACLRNRTSIARHLRDTGTVAVVAAGERWPDGSLRPCAEDLWGAGAVIAALVDLGVGGLSPEARVAEAAFRAVAADVPTHVRDCAGGRELAVAGFGADVVVAAELDVTDVVPLLGEDGAFRAG